ncbi:MAG: hypothetical protein RJA34_50 [Pseudomonadota bacterium]|jgi:hypothetical protein
MTAQDFIAKWGALNGVPGPAYALNEEQGAQSHFLDLCELLDVPKPGSAEGYKFEEKSHIVGGKTGYADVFMQGVFAWENKAPGKNLDSALKQLLTYSLALANPPILVVSDRLTIRVHTQFTGHPSETHTVGLYELDQPEKRALLRRIWTSPQSFKPRQTSRDITEAAAQSFAQLADSLRQRGHAPERVSHFLTQCVFSFFAEDVGLLPNRMFERLLANKQASAERLTQGLTQLFETMRSGGLFGVDDIPWFNGGLFKAVNVPALEPADLKPLRDAAALNWSAIDPSIFGTLFERGLDPTKRSQLGAHYTDPATIERIIGPVIRESLLQEWDQTHAELRRLLSKSKVKRRAAYTAAKRHFRATPGDIYFQRAEALMFKWLERLAAFRALDPACGSGNFLYLALKCLKDIEHHSHLQAADLGLDRQTDLVTGPHNVLGIELNEYAAELARVTVWIGELQWRIDHGYEFKTNPVLDALDHIECRDALLLFSDSGADAAGRGGPVLGAHEPAAPKSPQTPAPHAPQRNAGVPAVSEAVWPKADVIIGNPPFLGGSKKRGELGAEYFEHLNAVYAKRVPGGADLVCYWFDKARQQMQSGQLKAAGLVATQSIRAGSNRAVLTALADPIHIFNAWADEPWVNDGAAVRVSLVCFGLGERQAVLSGQPVMQIHADLSAGDGLDLTLAKPLAASIGCSFKGPEKTGAFDIFGADARKWLTQPNPNGKPNSDVLLPWRNGSDIAGRSQDLWVIDFGTNMPIEAASLYEAPFSRVETYVKPERIQNNDRGRRENWWRFGRNGADVRKAVQSLPRFAVTPRVAKHRFFVWLAQPVSPDSRLNVIARADDTTFGILSSRIHELWSLAQASMHGVGNDPTYNAKSCFETFTFPPGLSPADTAHQRTEALEGGALIPAGLPEKYESKVLQMLAGVGFLTTPVAGPKAHATSIAQAAKRLDDLRQNWLNPPEWTQTVPEVVPLGLSASPYPDRIVARPGFEKQLAERTLTKLYNQRPAWLSQAHAALDAAVAAAYGWADYTPAMPDDEILKRLLTLNMSASRLDKV